MSLLEMISQQLDDQALSQVSQRLGTDQATTQRAVAAALPMLVEGLARNAQQPQGANALASALDRDHDGSVLDNLHGFLGGGGAESLGGSILGHIFGARQSAAQEGLGQLGGLDGQKASQLLAMLAPLVLGALGRQKRAGGLGADGVADMLGTERRQVEQANPRGASIFEQMLDRDGDGSVADDVASIGMDLLGGFLGGKRR
ncbi:MAG: DUF937 domain-containing protein [Acidobacteriota bacterium]